MENFLYINKSIIILFESKTLFTKFKPIGIQKNFVVEYFKAYEIVYEIEYFLVTNCSILMSI